MWPLAARPQVPNKRPLIGLLLGGSEESTRRSLLAFQRGMRDCGYRTGFNYASFDDLVGAEHEKLFSLTIMPLARFALIQAVDQGHVLALARKLADSRADGRDLE
jgi:hypothetical protein